MSENITHVAVCDDVARLASRHPEVHPYFDEVLRTHQDVARFDVGVPELSLAYAGPAESAAR